MANTRKIEVVIVGDAKSLEAALGKAGASVQGFGKLGDRVHSGFASVATGLTKAAKVGGIGVAVGLGFAISAAGNFEQTLNTLWAVADHGGARLSDVSKKAIQLGADIKLPSTSAKDAADAMFELAKGGLNVKQAMAAARGTILLSTAAQIDNAAAGKAVVQALKAFKLPASQAQAVVDDFAGAANQSTADMAGVTEAMAQAGSGAKALNVPIGDTATAIAELANAGIQGGLAGSSLSTALVRLASGAKPVKAELKKLNISAFDAQGNFIGMSKFAGVYTAAMAKLTPQQRLQATATIFGMRGMKAALNVFGAGAKTFDDLRKKVTKSGQAQDLANAQSKGFKGAMNGLRSTLETLQITIGLKLLPYATRFARWLTEIAGSKGADAVVTGLFNALLKMGEAAKKAYDVAVTLFGFYERHAGVIQLVTGFIAGLVVGIEIYILTVRAVAAATAAWAAIQALLDGLLVANPIGLVVVAIAALIAVLVVLYVKNKAFHDAIQATFGWMKSNIPPIIDKIASVIRGVWGALAPFVKMQFSNIAGFVKAYLNVIKDVINLFGDVIHGRWGAIWGDVKKLAVDGIKLVWAYLKAQYGVPVAIFLKLGRLAGQGLLSGLKALPKTLWGLVRGALSFVVDSIPGVLGALKSAGSWIANAIVDGIKGLPGALASVASSALNAIKSKLESFSVKIKTKTYLGVPIPTGFKIGFSGGSGGAAPATTTGDAGDTGDSGFLQRVTKAASKYLTAIQTGIENGTISGVSASGGGGTKGGFKMPSVSIPGAGGSPSGGSPGGGGGDGGSDKAADKAKARLQTLADAAAKVRDLIVAKLDSAFQKVSDFAGRAFDGVTNTHLKELQDAADDTARNIQKTLDTTLAGINATQAALTPAEQALRDLQSGHDQAGRDADAAQGASDLAKATTPEEVAAAQKEIDDAAYNQKVFDLGVQAAAERAIADQTAADAATEATRRATTEQDANTAKLARDQLNYQASRDLQKVKLDEQLADFKENLNKHPGVWKKVHEKVMSLFTNDFGPDFATAGLNIGNAYVDGLAKAFASVGALTGAAGKAIGNANKANAKVGSHAQGGVYSSATLGWFGEDGPEAIVPLSKPARRDQVLREAGLAGTGTTVIQNITFAPDTPVTAGLAVAGYRARMALG